MKKRSAPGTREVEVLGEGFSGWSGWVGQVMSAQRSQSGVEGSAVAASCGFVELGLVRPHGTNRVRGAGLDRVCGRDRAAGDQHDSQRVSGGRRLVALFEAGLLFNRGGVGAKVSCLAGAKSVSDDAGDGLASRAE